MIPKEPVGNSRTDATYMTSIQSSNAEGLLNGKVTGIGKEEEGLYIIRKHIKPVVGAVVRGHEEQILWNYRLGHASAKSMSHISSIRHKVDVKQQQDCMICPLAKKCRLKFSTSSSQSSSIF